MIDLMAEEDDAPKSALDIAMARLRQKDAERGEQASSLTDEQKARIADVRQAAQAKLAQEDILYKASLAKTWDPEARAKLDAEHRLDVQRINDEAERKVEKIRQGR
jgi:hypothetical protein